MELDARQTLIIAILVLYLGRYLNDKLSLLREYNIPEPVTGGLLASVFFGLIYWLADTEISFDLANRDMLLVVFFTTIGLSSRVDVLKQGGRALVVLLVLAAGYLVIQNLVGVAVAMLFGGQPVSGLLAGSISFSGGHGTAIAWAPTFAEAYGISRAMEIALACATFGLIAGGLVGGPVARYLVWRHKLAAEEGGELTVGFRYKEHEIINVDGILKVLLVIAVAIGLGTHLNALFKMWGSECPISALRFHTGYTGSA